MQRGTIIDRHSSTAVDEFGNWISVARSHFAYKNSEFYFPYERAECCERRENSEVQMRSARVDATLYDVQRGITESLRGNCVLRRLRCNCGTYNARAVFPSESRPRPPALEYAVLVIALVRYRRRCGIQTCVFFWGATTSDACGLLIWYFLRARCDLSPKPVSVGPMNRDYRDVNWSRRLHRWKKLVSRLTYMSHVRYSFLFLPINLTSVIASSFTINST